jgi:hypothetical protein
MTSTDYSDMTARVLDGEALRIGSLYWPRPEPPLLIERARIVASAIPSGTIAAGVSAGWVWTGMGVPTPLSLIAASSPSPSPLIRHEWKIRGVKVLPTRITTMGPLTLLTPEATAHDLWTCDAVDEVAAAQLFWLDSEPPDNTQERTRRRHRMILQWRADYPWATRYTS